MDDWRDEILATHTVSDAASRLGSLVSGVAGGGSPVIIESESGDAVIMSASDYRSTMETLHLFSTPENASHLMESFDQARRGDTVEYRGFAEPDSNLAQGT